jgi:hypothetical protein
MFGPMSVTATFANPLPPHEVWAAFTDVARWPEVLPDLASARIDPDGLLAPGATIQTVALPDRNVIDMSYQVIDVEPVQRLVLDSSAEGFSARTIYEFAPGESGAGTAVTATAFVKAERFSDRASSILWRKKYIELIERSVRRRTTALLELTGTSEP